MLYFPQHNDIRYVKKFVLFPIGIDGRVYKFQFVYLKQYYGCCYWHNMYTVTKEEYVKWKKGVR